MGAQVGHAVGAERAHIGQPAPVHRVVVRAAQGKVGLRHLGLLDLQVVVQQPEAHQRVQLLILQEAHAGGVDAQRPLDAPRAGLEHVPIVAVAL
ncbi:hypothetical protein D3C72_1355740 [compost metagenome]